MAIEEKKLLKPTIDFVFKKIFGEVGNEEITKDLLKNILPEEPIESIELDCNKELGRDYKDDKLGILDIRAMLSEKTQCNIEIQVCDREGLEERILYYWSKLFDRSIKKGQSYSSSQKTISILITAFEMKNLKELDTYLTKWHIREDYYHKYILTEKLEIVILELPKVEKYLGRNPELEKWVTFITNPGGIGMAEENENIKKAKEVLEEISDDEDVAEMAWKREIFLMDQKAIRSSGYNEGREDGITEEKKEMAKKMLEDKVDVSLIIKYTGLSEEEIEKLK